MAKQPNPNDKPTKAPDGAAPITPKPAPPSPIPGFPNMSLDDPADDVMDVEEVLDDVVELVDGDELDYVEEVPIVEAAAMDSAVVAVADADVVADDMIDAGEILEAAPMDSAIVDVDAEADALFAATEENNVAASEDDPVFVDADELAEADEAVQVVDSAVVLMEPVSSGVVSARVESPVRPPSGSLSNVDLVQLFDDEPAEQTPTPTPNHVDSFPAADLSEVTGSEMPALAEEPISELSGQVVADDATDFAGQEPLPTGDGAVSEATSIEPGAAEPVSDVRIVEAEEIAPVAESPISDIALADLFGAPTAEAVPSSAVEAAAPVNEDDVDLANMFAEEVAEAVPASTIEEVNPEDDAASLFTEANEEVAEAVPASTIEEVEPASDVEDNVASLFTEEDEAAVAEAMPASAVEVSEPLDDDDAASLFAEQADEVVGEEAAPANDDDHVEMFDSDIAEAMPASAVEVSEPMADEEVDLVSMFAEQGDEPVAEEAPASAVEVAMPTSDAEDDDLFAAQAEEPIEEAMPASAVQVDDLFAAQAEEADEEVMPASAVEVAMPTTGADDDDLFAAQADEPIAEAMPASAVQVDDLFAAQAEEAVEEVMPASAVEVAMPTSDADDDDLFAAQAEEPIEEAMPASAVQVDDLFTAQAEEAVDEVMPASAVEVAMPTSDADDDDLFAAQAEEPIEEAMPASAMAVSEPVSDEEVDLVSMFAEEADEPIAEAAPASAVELAMPMNEADDDSVEALADDVVDAMPASAVEVSQPLSDDGLENLFGDDEEEVAEAEPASVIEAATPVADDDDEIASLFAEESDEPVMEVMPASEVKAGTPASDSDVDLVSLFAQEASEPSAEPISGKVAEAATPIPFVQESIKVAEPVATSGSGKSARATTPFPLVDENIKVAELAKPFGPKSSVNEAKAFADAPVAAPDSGPPTAPHVASDAALRNLFGVKEPSGAPPEAPLAPKSDVKAEARPIVDVPLSMNDLTATMPASGSVAKRPLADDMRETVPPSEVIARAPAGDFGATIPLSGVGGGPRSAAAPVSDILFPSDGEEFPAAATASTAKKAEAADKTGSDIVPESSVLLDDGIEEVAEATPASDVLFDAAEEAVDEAEEAVPKSSVFFDSGVEAIEEIDDVDDDIVDAVEDEAIDDVEDAVEDEAIDDVEDAVEEIDEAADDILDADEEILEAEEDLDDELAEVAVASDDLLDESVDEVADAVGEIEEDELTPSSGVVFDEAIEDVEEAAPASDVLFDAAEDEALEAIEDVEEAAPASDVLFDAAEDEALEAIEDVEEAAPASDVLFDAAEDEALEAIEDVEEAAPASDVLFDAAEDEALEAIEDVEEAAPASDVLFDAAEDEALEAIEDVEEAAPASDVLFDAAEEEADEIVEAIEEEDDAAVLASEDIEKTEIGSSSVFIDDTIPKGSSAKKASGPASGQKSGKTVAFDQTIAFQPMSKAKSKAKKSDDDDLLVTEEELDGAVEASAVDLGEMAQPKGSSAKGIDKLAEALESGLDVGARDMQETVGPEPSVVFDEILDDDSTETPKGKGKGKGKKSKSRLDDGSTETDSAVVPTKGGKNVKKVTKATGDDIDLDAMFEESDAEEAVTFDEGEADDAVEFDEDVAEAAEAFDADDEEAEAAEAFDADDEEAEPAEAFDADDEEAEAAGAFDADEDEAEAAEAFDADDEEAEAAEAFDAFDAEDEAEAAEAAEEVDEDAAAAALFDDDDFTPAKKSATKFGKKTSMHDDEEPEAAEDAEEPEPEEAAAFEDDDDKPVKKGKTKLSKKPAYDDEDDDEDVSTARKKGRPEKAVPATAPASGSSTILRVFVGMFLMTLILAGAGAGAYFGMPDQTKEFAHQVFPPPPPAKPKPPERWVLARAEAAQGKYKEAAEILKDANDANELGVRGEAVWLEYYGRQKKAEKPLDEKAPEVIGAKKDLADAKATVLLDQVNATLKDQKLTDEINKMKGIEADSQKQLEAARADKIKADKAIDAVADVLVKGKHIDDKAMFDVTALEKILKSLGDDKTTLEMVNKLLEDAKIKDKGDKGVAEVITDRNAVAKDRDDALATLVAAFKELIDGKVVPDKADARKEIVAGTKKLTKDRDDLFDTLLAAFKELVDGKIVPENADARKEIVAGTKLARQKAESPLSIPLAQLGMSIGGVGSGASKIVEQSFDMAKIFSELGFFKTREPFIQTPEQKLDTYITLLQDRKQNNPKELDAIRRETDWVLSEKSKADDEARTKARFVLGLTMRNEERFDDARTAFEEAAKLLKNLDKPGSWHTLVAKSQREIVDPTAYFLPRIDRFQTDGNLKAAIDEANLGLKAMPEEARLFAQRGLLRFELVRGKGAKLGEVAQKAIREDAEAAAKDEKLVAESAYILGLLEEELGNLVEAEKQYRQALKMHQGMADEAGRYRVALARLLLRDRPEVDAPAPKQNPDEKKKDAGARLERELEPNSRVTIVHPLTSLVVAAVIGQPVPEELEDKETLARLRETIKLAEELINESKNPKIQGQGYLLRGSARSKLGDRTAGLKDYAIGLKLLFPGIQTAELTKLIEDHPAFQQPDSAKTQNPVLAERHFGEGIHYYWAGNYPRAEIQFKQAVKYFERDARYQYYLGLAMLQQRTKLKRDAAFFAFDKGAQLEAEALASNPFVVRDINQSLERIQGELRQFLNEFRYKTQGESAVK